ncbi:MULTISPECIES: hypothetical protein [unclassified Paenibacillus]|uniref:hypothetical protein n=1 Tax=unclassified Paenibacillus TaxID=185978 RepID=UPI0036D3151C
MLKLLVKEKVIKINISRWDRLFDKDRKLQDDKLLIIEATDKPSTYKDIAVNGKEIDVPCNPKEENYYISLDMPLIQHYINLGLNERFLGLHCLISKLSNGTEGKSWMSINNMADVLGFGDKTVNAMIHEMNRKCLLYSRYMVSSQKKISKNGKSENGKMFEHHLLVNLSYKDEWLAAYKSGIDKNIRNWDENRKIAVT